MTLVAGGARFQQPAGPPAGFPELIKRQLPADHPAIAYCDAMLEATQRLADINTDFLTLRRRGHFEPAPVDLNHLVESTIAQVGTSSASIALRRELAPDLLPVSGSASQLLRVLTNLLVNAQDVVGEAGAIHGANRQRVPGRAGRSLRAGGTR